MIDCKKNHTDIIIIGLALVSLITFGQISGNDFIDLDDPGYITENNHVQSGISLQNIHWAFTTVVLSNWHPLTMVSHMLDWSLFGTNASGHHLVSLLLHIGAVVFLFLFLNKTTNNLWSSAFAAALFALHPLRVESVAWAAERKDVLSMFFGMAALYAYASYVDSSKYSRYFICLTLFILSLMSKPMLVTLPFVLLLLDYWPLKRWQKAIAAPIENRDKLAIRLAWEKSPFFLLTILSSMMTFYAQNKDGAVASAMTLPYATRVANAIISYVVYLRKTFWPVDLAVFYPYEFSPALWKILLSGIILITITTFVIYHMKKMPFLLVGWFWYLGTLVPVIGLIQIGSQAMADRYTYLPSIGIAIMLSWGVPYLFKHEKERRAIILPVALIALAILAFLTWRQCGFWKNSETLFSHALQVTNNNYLAHNNLAFYLNKKGNLKEAIDHCNEAIRIKPVYTEAYNNRGFAYTKLGQYHLAINDLSKTIRMKPDYPNAYNNRGTCFDKTGQYQRAIDDYNEAIRLKPNYAEAYYNRGNMYANAKPDQCELAIMDYNEAIRLKPDYADAYNNRGICFEKTGQQQRAIDDYNKAIRLKPDSYDAYYNRALIYLNAGKINDGCHDAQKACQLGNCTLFETAKSKGDCHK